MDLLITSLPYVLGITLVAIVGVLLTGIVAMGSSRSKPMFRNKMMRARIVLQGLAVILFVLLIVFGRGG